MKKVSLFFIITILLFACKGRSQEEERKELEISESLPAYWSEADSMFFQNLPDTLHEVTAWAKFFLGTPYKSATLEKGDDYVCLVNLQAFDCTTFVENIIALSTLDTLCQEDFTKRLVALRYRSGSMQGYPSRLHYFSEWIADNEQKGIIKDVTKEVGGVAVSKKLNFMSTHRKSYPALKDSLFCEAIQQTEAELSQQVRYILSKEKLEEHKSQIKEGDIIALATNIKGLDFVHLGFATQNVKTGELHLLHASSVEKKVVISTKILVNYLLYNKNVSGIAVLRINKD